MRKRLFRPKVAEPAEVRPTPRQVWLISVALPPLPLNPRRALRIGRKPTCDFVIVDKRISREHAEIFFKSGAVWIRDLGSHNGTWVNGSRIETVARLALGSTVHLEDHAFVVSDKAFSSPEELSTSHGMATRTSCEAPVETCLRGELEQLSLSNTLQALDLSAQTGTLAVRFEGGPKGTVGIRLGRPVWAKVHDQDLRGEKALIELLTRPQLGTFQFSSRNPGVETEIRRSLTELLLDCASVADEGVSGPA